MIEHQSHLLVNVGESSGGLSLEALEEHVEDYIHGDGMAKCRLYNEEDIHYGVESKVLLC